MPGWETRLTGMDVEGRPRVAKGDRITETLVVITSPHHEIHTGSTFHASYKSPEGGDIADNGVLDFLIAAGLNKYTHLTFSCSMGGDAEVFFYEGTTVSDNGTIVARPNVKRTSTALASTRTYHTPTVTAPGTLLLNRLLAGGSGAAAIGGSQGVEKEWILKRETLYLIRLINRSGAAEPLGIVAYWYEEDQD